MALGRPAWSAVRSWLTELLTHPAERELVESHLIAAADVTMHLPFEVADYVDFYSSSTTPRTSAASSDPTPMR